MKWERKKVPRHDVSRDRGTKTLGNTPIVGDTCSKITSAAATCSEQGRHMRTKGVCGKSAALVK